MGVGDSVLAVGGRTKKNGLISVVFYSRTRKGLIYYQLKGNYMGLIALLFRNKVGTARCFGEVHLHALNRRIELEILGDLAIVQ